MPRTPSNTRTRIIKDLPAEALRKPVRKRPSHAHRLTSKCRLRYHSATMSEPNLSLAPPGSGAADSSPADDLSLVSSVASTEVFAVHGAEPEVQAYAMAKYSRSSLSMKESLREINEQKAEKFLNTFYFQYGHRSIADLAHMAFAIEKLSILAAIAVVDEQRWDGQERSTRYQNFKKGGWYVPTFGDHSEAARLYDETIREPVRGV